MRYVKSLFHIWTFFLLSVCTAFAQEGTMTTYAGGGMQNNIPGLLADISLAEAVAVDRNSNVYIASCSLNQVFKLTPSGELFTVAGNGASGFSGDGGPATGAELGGAYFGSCRLAGVAADGSGNVFIADVGNQRIRRVDAATQIITTVAGNGTPGFSGDGGPATSAELNFPGEVAVDSSGDLFIADSRNHRIRRVDAATQVITTVAGNGTKGYSGDGGPATGSELDYPAGVAVDSSGDLFIADTGNERIRRVDAATQVITTFAGNGTEGFGGDGGPATSAQLLTPEGLAMDSSADLFIADVNNERVRRVDATTNIITTVAGNGTVGFSGDGGLATNAELDVPAAVALDGSGDLFIADVDNGRIRYVKSSTQVISTIAGGAGGGDGGPASASVLAWPEGVALDSAGNLFVADFFNWRIRRVDGVTGMITTVAGNGIPCVGYENCGYGGPATSAELFDPGAPAADESGNVFFSVGGFGTPVLRIDATTQVLTVVAGNGNASYRGDGGPATSAGLSACGVAVDGSGDLFFADCQNARIRRVDAVTHIITTVAGNGNQGYSGDGGPATSAELSDPTGVAVDSSGDLFIADSSNCRIRRVDAATQIISTVTTFSELVGVIAVDRVGNLYVSVGSAECLGDGVFFSGVGSSIVRLDAVTGATARVAGTGVYGFSGDGGPATSSEIGSPSGVAVGSTGMLYISDSSNNRVRETTLPPFVALQPTALTFSNQNIGTTSPIQTVKLTNTGLVPLAVSSIDASAGFQETDNCGSSVAANTYCTLEVTFDPTVPGAQTGTITVTDNSFGSPHIISLTGTGTGPVASLPAPPTFPSEPVGTTSPAQTVTLTNTGNANLTFTAIGVTGPFAIAASGTTCSTSSPVAPSGSCSAAITFTPTAVGTNSGSLSFTDNATNSPQTVGLTGTGTGAVVSLPAPPTFPSEPVGTTSPSQTVTVTNTGNANLTFTAIGVSGPFAIAASGTTCSTSSPVAASGSCTVSLTFTPTAVGTASGSLSFTDNGGNSPQTVSLTGTGTGAIVSLSAPPTFPSEPVGTTSPPQTVTVTNTGNASLTFTAISTTGPFAIATSGTTCSTSNPVAASGSCTVALTFTPTTVGTASGSPRLRTTPLTARRPSA